MFWSRSIPASTPRDSVRGTADRAGEVITTRDTSSVNQSCYCLAAESLWPSGKSVFLAVAEVLFTNHQSENFEMPVKYVSRRNGR